jgi:hypothetical protein
MVARGGTPVTGVRLTDVTIPALLALVWRPVPDPARERFVALCRRAFAPRV